MPFIDNPAKKKAQEMRQDPPKGNKSVVVPQMPWLGPPQQKPPKKPCCPDAKPQA